MSSYHVRAGAADGNSFEVIFHLPVPAATLNRAGINLRTLLLNTGIGGKSIMTVGIGPGLITQQEMDQITNGEIYEHVEQMDTNPGETLVALRNKIDARYNSLLANERPRIEKRLTYWGFDRDVP